MADANVKVEMNGGADGKHGFEMPLFGMLKIAMPEAFRGLAEPSVVRMKENCEKMKAVSGEMADALRETYSTNAKGAADYGAKVIDITNANTTSALEFLTNLVDAKSLPDIVNLSITQARKNFDVASAQNKELWDLAQKVASEAAEPIKKSVAGALQKVG